MTIKKTLLLLLTIVLIVSCKQEELLEQNADTANLSSDLKIHDNSNLGLYKGTFTTLDASERGVVEVKILHNVPSRATLTLSSGATYSLKSTSVVTSGKDTSLRFVAAAESKDSVAFDFSVSADGTDIEITNTSLGSKASHIIAAKETSRAPVVPITGTYLCTACGTHPNLGTVTQTFNMVYTGNGSDDDTIITDITLGATVYTSPASENSQPFCGPSPTTPGFFDCPITGTTVVTTGGPLITWSGTHTYNSSATNCSQVDGSWTYISPAYGSLAGTLTSDAQCIPAAIGDLREGGIVFYIAPTPTDLDGDGIPDRGLVCALEDFGNEVEWGCYGIDLPSVPNVISFPTVPPFGLGAEIGDGITNTNAILADCPTAPAALAARSLDPEWFLPSAKELNEMYLNRAALQAVPGFVPFGMNYWSSTESDSLSAWLQIFLSIVVQGNATKNSTANVRAVRAF